MGILSPKVPAPTLPPAPPAITTKASPDQSPAARDAQDRERRRRRAAFGPASTLLTGGQGVTGAASTTGKTLLGG